MASAKGRTALVLVLLLALVTAGTVVGLPQPPPAPAPGADGPTLGEAVVRMDRYDDPLPPGALVRMGTVRLRHGGLNGLTFTPDGRSLVSVGVDQTVRVWDPTTGRERRRLPGPPGQLSHTQSLFSADGKLLAFADRSAVRLWDVPGAKELVGIPCEDLTAFALAPDGQTLATGDRDGQVRLWDLATHHEKKQTTLEKSVKTLVFAPDGQVLAAPMSGWGRPRLWNPRADTIRARLDTKDRAFAFSPDGALFASLDQGPVTLWDARTGERLHTFALPDPHPCLPHPGVAFSPDGRTLAAGGNGRPVVLWDVPSRKELHRLPVDQANLLVFAPDGGTLASGATHVIRLWDVKTGRELHPRDAHTGEANAVAISPDGTLVASGSWDDNTVRIWDRATGRSLHLLSGPKGSVRVVAFSPDGRTLATDGGDGTVRLWDPATGRERRVLRLVGQPGDEYPQVMRLTFAADGSTLAIVVFSLERKGRHKENTTLLKLDLKRGGEPVVTALDPTNASPAPDGRTLAYTRPDRVILEDLATGTKRALQTGETLGTIQPVIFSPNGRFMACRGADPGIVLIAAVAEGRWLVKVDTGMFFNTIPVFSADERYLATLTPQALSLWEVASGREVVRHPHPLNRAGDYSFAGGDSLAFTPHSRALATGLADSTVLLWNLTPARGPGEAQRTFQRADFDRLWEDLKGEGGPKSYAAMWALAQGPPEVVVPRLRERYAPADEALVRRLVRDLDSDDFPVRQSAEKQLEDLGERAWPFFREALAANPSLEVRQRLERLQAAGGRSLRALRAVEVLERIDTPAARQLLGDWAREADDAVLPREARAALERLKRRSV